MKDYEQNNAVATYNGIKEIEFYRPGRDKDDLTFTEPAPFWRGVDSKGWYVKIPDYVNDIDAIRSAIDSLPYELCDYREEGNIWDNLLEVMGAEYVECLPKLADRLWNISAKDCTKAFLLTVKK